VSDKGRFHDLEAAETPAIHDDGLDKADFHSALRTQVGLEVPFERLESSGAFGLEHEFAREGGRRIGYRFHLMLSLGDGLWGIACDFG
jgi:hypothetical protein